MPTNSSFSDEHYHSFTNETRQSFIEALTLRTMTRARTFELVQEAEQLSKENETLRAENESLKKKLKRK
jgi:regulator of replication initiation timing